MIIEYLDGLLGSYIGITGVSLLIVVLLILIAFILLFRRFR